MDYLQYLSPQELKGAPESDVLNLIINGLPSIQLIIY